MRILRLVAIVLGGLLALALVVAVAARFADGPIGPFPGGPLRGEPERGPEPDWAFLDATSTVALEVHPPAPRSVSVWIVRVDGALYVPSAAAPRKRWPSQVMADGRVRLRAGERLFERQAVRVEGASLLPRLREAAAAKYEITPDRVDPETTWFFRLDPR